MTESWWSGLLPVEVQLDCSNETHRIRWEGGSLVALDHEDPDGERTLGALGADRASCIEILDAWIRHSDDLRVLTVSSRGPADPVQFDVEGQGPGTGIRGLRPARGLVAATPAGPRGFGWTSFASPGAQPMIQRHPPGPFDGITDLLALGGAMAQRLVATVVAAWSERIGDGAETAAGHAPALTAALYGRVASSVRSWLADADLEVELEMIPASESPSMHLDGPRIHVRLPFLWLSQIWVKDLPVVFSRFAIGMLSSLPDQLQLLTVSPDLSEVRPVTIRLD